MCGFVMICSQLVKLRRSMHTNIFRVLRLEDMTHGTVGIIPTKSANYENDKKFRKLSELWLFDKKNVVYDTFLQ